MWGKAWWAHAGWERWRLILVFGGDSGRVLLMSGQSVLLEGSHHGVLCSQGLLPEFRDKPERRAQSVKSRLRSGWRSWTSSFNRRQGLLGDCWPNVPVLKEGCLKEGILSFSFGILTCKGVGIRATTTVLTLDGPVWRDHAETGRAGIWGENPQRSLMMSLSCWINQLIA